MKYRLIAVIAVLVIVASGCAEKSKVGTGVDLDNATAEQRRLGERTTTTAPPPTGNSQLAIGATTTTKPPSTSTTRRPATTTTVQTFDIAITGDQSGKSQFEPAQVRVFAGTVVRWVNKDSQPRSVEADNGEFTSPMLPPGGSFTYTASKAGKFAYHDGTRPYAVGTLEVIAR